MKKYYAVLFALILFVSCKKENDPSLNEISSFVRDNYTEDAQKILLRRIMNKENVKGKNDNEFNKAELNRILSDIQAVYNLRSSVTERIFNTAQIHAFPNPQLYYLTLQVDQNSGQGAAILKYQNSGNVAFEALKLKYGFVYQQYSSPFSRFVSMKTNTAYNLVALSKVFNEFPFIEGAELESSIGDGNNISYTQEGNTAMLNFSIGSGDCPAGCIYRTGWIFVITNGKATLSKTY